MYKILLFLLFPIVYFTTVLCFPQGKEYPLRLQPELDILDVESYLNNPRLLNLQIGCILFDKTCDIVGKWAKPRVKAGLLGECLLCTEKQKGWLDLWLDRLIKNFPDLYRAGVAKFILNTGVDVPAEEIAKLKSTFHRLETDGLNGTASANTTEDASTLTSSIEPNLSLTVLNNSTATNATSTEAPTS